VSDERIIFLDVDGVLNNLGSVIGLGNPSKVFDPVSVALIRKLIDKTGARIVVSSTWRMCPSESYLKQELERCGADKLTWFIIGCTPELSGPRGAEIARWIADKGFTGRYVIIDDDSDMLQEQMPMFVQTTFEDGFRVRHYKRALEILGEQDEAIIIPATATAC
jgi:hypothetical protein